MRALICLSFALGCTFLSAANADRYLLLLNLSPTLTGHLKASQLVYAEEDVSVVTVPFDEIEAWSHRVHEELGGCGGFIDVTGKVEKGRSPQVLVWEELLRRQMPVRSLPFPVAGRAEIAAMVAQADADTLWAFLTELSEFPDRSATTDNGGKAAKFIKDHAQAIGGNLTGFHTWTVETGTYEKQPSVVATLPGTDPTLPHIVIGGHMDTFSSAKPGADDDGSGSSVVMESLRVVASMKAHFAHTIDFIWYSAEERGLVGSSYVVDHFDDKGMNVAAAIQFDMTGHKSPDDKQDLYVITDYTDSSLNSALKKMLAFYLPEVKVGETRCGYPCSDHANWTRAGIPAVFPFESSFGNMNERIHTGEDKITYLDKDHSLTFAKLALAFLGEMAKYQGSR